MAPKKFVPPSLPWSFWSPGEADLPLNGLGYFYEHVRWERFNNFEWWEFSPDPEWMRQWRSQNRARAIRRWQSAIVDVIHLLRIGAIP